MEYLQVMFHSLNGDLLRVGLGVEADKVEVMHFWKKRKPWKPDKPTGPDVVIEIDRKINRIVPKISMRYLGFYLDPKLSFKSHIRFYAAKAASTVSTLTMLGNSLRGFTPMQKRQLYIAHVLPLMCYGAHLWWKPGWKGIGWIAKEMQGAQSRAVRWITGAFRTTPIGAMELIAGVVPVRVNITRYMEKHALRIKTLHPGHPTRALMSHEWELSDVPTSDLNAEMPFRVGKHSKSKSPMVHFDEQAFLRSVAGR